MANEITSMVKALVLTPVSRSGQFTKLSTVNAPEVGDQSLPVSGNVLPQAAESRSLTSTQLQEVVSQINEFVQTIERDLTFSHDEISGKMVIKVVDSGSGELVRQIPSEEVLALATVFEDVSNDSTVAERIPTGILFSEST